MKIIIIWGPRRTGKTTAAKQHLGTMYAELRDDYPPHLMLRTKPNVLTGCVLWETVYNPLGSHATSIIENLRNSKINIKYNENERGARTCVQDIETLVIVSMRPPWEWFLEDEKTQANEALKEELRSLTTLVQHRNMETGEMETDAWPN